VASESIYQDGKEKGLFVRLLSSVSAFVQDLGSRGTAVKKNIQK
jgi:hypothetical protein